MLSPDTFLEKLQGIGPITQRKLKKLGVKTINDLLFHFPSRYEDFSNLIPISKIKLNQTCSVRGKILEIKSIRTWKRKMIVTNALIQDQTGAMQIVWFNQPYLTRILKKGEEILVSGKTILGKLGIHFANPQYEKPDPSSRTSANSVHCGAGLGKTPTHTAGIIPVYPETEGLSSRWIRTIIKQLLILFRNKLPETLPPEIIKENGFLPINQAIWQIHFPDSLKSAERARQRLSFEELLYIELFVLRERLKLNKEKAAPIPLKLDAVQKFVGSLPFKLTDDQRKSAWQALKDMEKSRPMNRLLQGDVGSGKTVVAAIIALNAFKSGYQTAFMAPTEILAKQHFKTVFDALKNFSITIGLLTGKEDKIYSHKLKNDTIEVSRNKLLKMIKGEINPYTKKLDTKLDILIGTHALIQDKVKFGKLALVVVDEQHRFGVGQRARLCQPASPELQRGQGSGGQAKLIPHLLSMTATPIPRTLALTVYGDLDLSLITQMPIGRKKIITKVIGPEDRKKTYEFIRKEVKKGRQVFVICPRIESQNSNLKSQNSNFSWADVKAVKEEYEKLSKNVFPDLKVGMLHGKMAGKEKEKTMKDFSRHAGKNKIDILVSTSVVEVGIDIPNATVMMIEGAERFGLAQLHQFRGRVGRSKYQSYCFLLTTSPDQLNRRRLKALVESESGFKLAEKDLEIRGPGDLSGARQWGIPDLAMSSLKDLKLIEKTREAAKKILQEDPQFKKYPNMLARLGKFREKIHFE